MKRRLGIIVMAMLLAALLAAPAMAATDEATLGTELDAGNAKLANDIQVSNGIVITNTATLDLNGFTLEIADSVKNSKSILSVGNSGKLTITDASSSAAGIIESKATSRDVAYAIYIHDGGSVVLEKGTVQTTEYGDPIRIEGKITKNSVNNEPIYSSFTMNGGKVIGGQWVIRPYGNGATVTINDGEINGNGKYNNYSTIQGLGSVGYGGTIININGGKLVGGNEGAAIYHPQEGTLNISGGELSGSDGVQFKSGTLKMTGGTISTVGSLPSGFVNNNNGSVETGAAISFVTSTAYAGNMNLNISGSATLIAKNSYALIEAITQGTMTGVVKVDISGGTFTGKDKALSFQNWSQLTSKSLTGGAYSSNPEDYVSEGYTVAYRDGMYVVEKPAPVPTKPDLPTDTPETVVPVEPSIQVVSPDATDSEKTAAVETAIGDVKDGTITAADLEVSPQGVVVPKETVVKAAALAVLEDPAKTVTVEEIVALPMFTATLESADNVAAIGYPLKGSDLKAAKAGDVKVLKILSAESGALFSFEGDPASTGDKEYALQVSGDKAYLAADAAIEAGKDYTLLLFIKDNGEFDLCSEAKKVIDPAAIVKAKEEGKSSGGSSGCNAGFAGMLLLAVVPFVVRRKK